MNTSNPKTATAVEWLYGYICEIALDNENAERLKWLYEQAKAIEKQQILNAHLTGLIHPLEKEATSQAQDYYNENYY